MSGQWRQDGPSTPDRIKSGANTTLDKMRGGKTVVIAVAAVAVILVAALVWATMGGSGDDRQPAADETGLDADDTAGDDEDGVNGLFPDGSYKLVNSEGCIGLAEHDEVDRWIMAARDCDAQQTYLSATFVADDTVRIGFLIEGFTEFCLRADGPELDDEEATEEDLYYFAPYECDEEDKLQEFTLLPQGDDQYQLQTGFGQCMAVFLAWGFPDGDGVGTAACEEGNLQAFAFEPI